MKNTIKKIQQVHMEKGWNGVHAYLRRNNIKHILSSVEFGTESIKAMSAKNEWLNSAGENQFRAHYYSVAVKAKKNGFVYNIVRGQQVELL